MTDYYKQSLNVNLTQRATGFFDKSPIVDRYLREDYRDKLYAKWKESWAAPLSLKGGMSGITCNMITTTGFGELTKVYGPKLAKLFVDTAQQMRYIDG